MSVQLTTLTVTPTWEAKRLTLSGSPSVRESVELTLVGCADDTSVVFKLSSEDGRTDYARFPWARADAWTVSGSDLTATLTLNTDKLVAAFRGFGPEDKVPALAVVSSPTNVNLYALGHVNLRNWVENDEDPVSYVAPLQVDMAALQNDMTALETTLGSHAHDGTQGGGGTISHDSLAGKGTLSHAALEIAIGGQTVSINNLTGSVAAVSGRMDALRATAQAVTVNAPQTNLDLVGLETITNTLSELYNFVQGVKGGLS